MNRIEELQNRISELESTTKKTQDELNSAVEKRENEQISELSKQLGETESELSALREELKLRESLKTAKEMLEEENSEEMKKMAEDEVARLEDEITRLEKAQKGTGGENDSIVEIRAGTGGEEAALFAADLYRMYTKYAEKHGWKTELMDLSETSIGGIKTVVFKILGEGAYTKLKYESGVHRVQRIPTTESSGRIHTSTATVAVLPLMTPMEVEINPSDIRIEAFRAGGPGGQGVNTTDSAVRVTHIPTGIVVKTQKSRSQIKNRELALEILRAKLYEEQQRKIMEEQGEMRKTQIGTGGRAEKIRTYNFPQDRITDHRIKKNWHGMERILDGDIDEMIAQINENLEGD